MGSQQTAEIWNNLGLCAFFSQQYDICLDFFHKALHSSTDDNVVADIWYNIGHVAIGAGDWEWAYESFQIAVSSCASHGEAWNNLAVRYFLSIYENAKLIIVNLIRFLKLRFKKRPSLHYVSVEQYERSPKSLKNLLTNTQHLLRGAKNQAHTCTSPIII
jgi:tetratricopeptide (TPR) repeat protein